MKRMKIRTLSLSVALLWLALATSQSHEAQLIEIKSDGLYTVLLPSNLRASSENNFDYLRVKDASGNEVPFVIMDAWDKQYSQFKAFEIFSKEILEDSISSFTFLNHASLKNTLSLRITNTSIDKRYKLFGSDDQEEWIGLLDQQRLDLSGSASKTFLEENINLPLNNFRFLRLVFDDKSSLPIQVEAIGVYENKYFPSEMLPLESFSAFGIKQGENKTTRLEFEADKYHQVDAISFKISNEFYYRNAAILIKKEREVKRSIEKYEEEFRSFTLSSKSSNSIILQDTYLSDFIIQIENEDNPPLLFEKVSLYQKPKYLVSYLKAKQDYTLTIDNSLSHPSYDLAYFVAQNIEDLKEAQLDELVSIKSDNALNDGASQEKSFWESKLFMWLAIALGGVLVIYFAISMLRDMGKS